MNEISYNNYSSPSPKRIVWMDWAKAIGIFLVVLGHMRVLHGKPLIYMFHMTYFFILSGFLFKRKSFKKEFSRSVNSLLIPYLCFNTLLLLVAFVVGDFEWNMIQKNFLCNYVFPVRYFSPLWFLVSLFIMRIVCSLVNERYYGLLAVCTILISIILFYTHHLPLDGEPDYFQWATTCICTPSFVFGYYLNRNNWLDIPNKVHLSIIRNGFIFMLFAGAVIIGKFNGRVNVFTCAVGHDILLYYGVSFIMSYIIMYYISDICTRNNKYIEIISTGTILILALHVAMIDGISFGIQMRSWSSMLLAIVIMAISSCLISFSIKYFPFLLGKKTNRII